MLELQRRCADGRPWAIRRVAADVVLPLRAAILRAGHPLDAAVFADDDAASTVHLAAHVDDLVIGCLSLMRADDDQRPAYQLRGMAVAPDWQGRGAGSALLVAAEDAVRAQDIAQLWCNARSHAVGFYREHGWRVVSAEFDIPGVGPHHRMRRILGQAAAPAG